MRITYSYVWDSSLSRTTFHGTGVPVSVSGLAWGAAVATGNATPLPARWP